MTAPDISPILDLAIRYNSNLATQNNYVIREWLAAGCDIEKDILPTMKQLMEKNRSIKSYKYFDKAVLQAHDMRIAKEMAAAKNAPPDEAAMRRKMERIAKLKEIAPFQFAAYRHELEAYEAKHGPV